MVMGGMRLQSQRRLLPKWQGLQIFRVVRTVLGPRRGPTTPLVQLWREVGQTWTDVGGSDRYEICIVGGDQWKTDREELAGGGTGRGLITALNYVSIQPGSVVLDK